MRTELELEMLLKLSKSPVRLIELVELAESEGQGRILLKHLSNKSYIQDTDLGWKITKLGHLRLRDLKAKGRPVGLAQSTEVKGKRVSVMHLPRFFRQGAEDAGALPSLVNGKQIF